MVDPFQRVLETRRAAFNSRFAEKLVTRSGLDGEAFLRVLNEYLAPVVRAVAQVNGDAAAGVGDALYTLALELYVRGLLNAPASEREGGREGVMGRGSEGARERGSEGEGESGSEGRTVGISGNGVSDAIAKVWRELLPALAPLLVAQPGRVAGSVINAAYNIAQVRETRVSEWVATMRALVPLCADADTLLRAGQVAAWRAGMAHYRLGALLALKTLDAPVARPIFGLDASVAKPDTNELHYALMANPWHDPAMVAGEEPALKIVRRVGGFRGFGGVFTTPPIVVWTRAGFVATDGENDFLLIADAFGATLHRTTQTREQKVESPFKLTRTGKVSLKKLNATFSELAQPSSTAANQNTLAVTTELTHTVYLVAVQ